MEQLRTKNYNTIIIRGKTEETITTKFGNVTLISSLTADKLQRIIGESQYIISRSGYSTVMDFAKLGVNAVFVPTPGQTEQEYLSKILMEKKICYSESQNNFDVVRAITESQNYPGFSELYVDDNILRERISNILNFNSTRL